MRVPDDSGGRNVRCPGCGKSFMVPLDPQQKAIADAEKRRASAEVRKAQAVARAAEDDARAAAGPPPIPERGVIGRTMDHFTATRADEAAAPARQRSAFSTGFGIMLGIIAAIIVFQVVMGGCCLSALGGLFKH
jgi:hypothetical protein